jgi:hypothetical protein
MMFLARVNSKGMPGNKLWYNPTYNKGANTVNALPNCTTFCVGESLEAIQAQVPMSFFVAPYDRDGAFPDASQWYKLWKGKKGLEPKAGGVCVWEGGNGHVAFVLETRDAGSKGAWVKVCQSNYKGVYFEVKEYYVKVGQVTTGVGKKYIGCVYNDVKDLRTTRNKNLEQVEVLTDSLNARITPNGVVYAGRRVLKGIYTIFDKMRAGDYVWAQLDKDTWIALNDKDGWTKTYDIENCEARYRTLLSAYEKLSQKYTDLVMKYERETGKKA